MKIELETNVFTPIHMTIETEEELNAFLMAFARLQDDFFNNVVENEGNARVTAQEAIRIHKQLVDKVYG